MPKMDMCLPKIKKKVFDQLQDVNMDHLDLNLRAKMMLLSPTNKVCKGVFLSRGEQTDLDLSMHPLGMHPPTSMLTRHTQPPGTHPQACMPRGHIPQVCMPLGMHAPQAHTPRHACPLCMHAPPQRILRDVVNERAVRILLECILVI